ncbi:MarR family winged helix-turn-helix transcriptional regulator [Pseudonocardia pini]|uniref:MarR family winged helix-turn-helix transcriptional regulator n=1 Tax=Pseudonocardia pini TaxID=2758030 RepID=UPI0015F0A4D1|nr:MarR family winged helix-turn-helix transcriptional regulator [Pseudonocardia pini]
MAAVAGDEGRRSTPGVCDRRESPGLLLALLGNRAMRHLRAAHDRQDLTPRQFQLLGMLQEGGEVGQSTLVEDLGLDPSLVVALLNPLEQRGLVTRTRSAVDRRRHTVALTEAGDALLAAAVAAQYAAEDELFAALTDEERTRLTEILRRMGEGGPVDAGAGACDEAPRSAGGC